MAPLLVPNNRESKHKPSMMSCRQSAQIEPRLKRFFLPIRLNKEMMLFFPFFDEKVFFVQCTF